VAEDARLLSGVTVLRAVIEAQSFARAAAALGLSPSAVSRSVARLEERLGARLLQRTTRCVRMTEEGRRFYQSVAPHLAGIETAIVEIGQAAGAVRGRLRVNMDPFLSRAVLAERLPAFLDAYPELSLELIMRDSVGDLVADGFDLALRFSEPPAGSFVARKLLDVQVLTVASPAYVEQHGLPKHPDDLADHSCILLYDPAQDLPFEWEFRRGAEVIPHQPRSRLLVSDVGAMLAACRNGGGVAQILALSARHLVESGALIQLLPDWAEEMFPLYAVFPTRRQQPAKVRAFTDFCQALLRNEAWKEAADLTVGAPAEKS
jgi:DNA-binding transcriptional LysR family regulator